MEEIKHLRECAENAEARRAGLEDYINSLRERAEKAEAEAYEFKLAAAGGEDAPGSANAVTVADVERWQKEHEATVKELFARAEKTERENAALYEWKERAGRMDREKTVRIVELKAERDEAVARAKTNAVLMAGETGKLIDATARADRIERETIKRCAKVADARAAICRDAVRLVREGKLYQNSPTAEATEQSAALEAEHIAAAIRAMRDAKP